MLSKQKIKLGIKAAINFVVLVCWFICFMLSANSYASDSIVVKRQGKEFVQTRVQKKAEAVDTGFKWTEETRDGDKLTYHVYINPNTGSCWYDKLSKSGKTYKKYLPKEYSKEIAKEIGITYKENRSNGTK